MDDFNGWGLVEVLGRRQYAGRIASTLVGNATFVQVDVPEVAGRPGYTKLIGATSIFALTPTDEATARRLAEAVREPAFPFVLPPPGGAPVASIEAADDYGEVP